MPPSSYAKTFSAVLVLAGLIVFFRTNKISVFSVSPLISAGTFISRWSRDSDHAQWQPKDNRTTWTPPISSAQGSTLTNDLAFGIANANYSARVQTLHDVCRKYHPKRTLGRIWKHSSNRIFGRSRFCTMDDCPIVVNMERRLLFCFNPKVASTAIKRLLLQLGGTNTTATTLAETDFHREANDLLYRVGAGFFPPHELRRFYKVIFVRHPFVRLVSAFKDKTDPTSGDHRYFYDNYWRPIVQRYRGATNATSDVPTFREFVRYLVDAPFSEYNGHWEPYWIRCSPCTVPYDFVGKLEWPQDFDHLISKVTGNISSNTRHVLPIGRHTANTSLQETRKYFLSVPTEEVRALYQKLQLDFELFGYSLQEVWP